MWDAHTHIHHIIFRVVPPRMHGNDIMWELAGDLIIWRAQPGNSNYLGLFKTDFFPTLFNILAFIIESTVKTRPPTDLVLSYAAAKISMLLYSDFRLDTISVTMLAPFCLIFIKSRTR
jgi:hypothetical protein